MQDFAVRGTAGGGQIRVAAARTTRLAEEARRRHQTMPTATAALGRVLTAAAIMGLDLTEGDTLTLRVLGDGPLGGVIAVAEAGGKVRGYVQEPATHLPPRPDGKLNVRGAVGSGWLHVSKDLGLKEPYTGSIPLVSGEIAEDLTKYFFVSEQTPSVIALGVLVGPEASVRASGGFFIQLLPGSDESVIRELEQNFNETLPPVSAMIDEGRTPEEILARALPGMPLSLYEGVPLSFTCNCSRERIGRVLKAMDPQEFQEMLVSGEELEVRCHFCNGVYHFEAGELQKF